MEVKLKAGERIDELQRNGYQIIQNENGFCFGMDAVLLSGFARVKKGEQALDLGTGTGIIPILLEAKTEGRHFTGLEIQETSADMAQRSVCLNDLQEKVRIVQGDIKSATELFGKGSMDVVTSNPPYMTGQILCTLEDVIGQASALLKENGRFYMVHRPFRLAEIMVMMSRYRLEPKRMKLVYPFVDKEPNMVLIEGLKGGRPRITVEKPLIVYEKPGVYTSEIYDIYGY